MGKGSRDIMVGNSAHHILLALKHFADLFPYIFIVVSHRHNAYRPDHIQMLISFMICKPAVLGFYKIFGISSKSPFPVQVFQLQFLCRFIIHGNGIINRIKVL